MLNLNGTPVRVLEVHDEAGFDLLVVATGTETLISFRVKAWELMADDWSAQVLEPIRQIYATNSQTRFDGENWLKKVTYLAETRTISEAIQTERSKIAAQLEHQANQLFGLAAQTKSRKDAVDLHNCSEYYKRMASNIRSGNLVFN